MATRKEWAVAMAARVKALEVEVQKLKGQKGAKPAAASATPKAAAKGADDDADDDDADDDDDSDWDMP